MTATVNRRKRRIILSSTLLTTKNFRRYGITAGFDYVINIIILSVGIYKISNPPVQCFKETEALEKRRE